MCNLVISLETEFIIYGVGEVGNRCYSALKRAGYNIKFAIDNVKIGDGIIDGIYTYSLETSPVCDGVVIICLADGILHKEVSEKIYAHGFKYIVFLPMEFCIEDREKSEIIKLYNDILDAKNEMLGREICSYSKFLTPDLRIGNGILIDRSTELTVWCGVELLFTESLEHWEGDKNKVIGKDKYKDINIASCQVYKSIFDFFAGIIDNCDMYFEGYNENIKKDNQLIARRERLYKVYEKEYNKGLAFFINSAPRAVWNSKGYWNLVGGHHRTLFLLHRGHNLFPIKIKRSDFDIWYNKDAYEKLKEYIISRHISKLYAPFPHPGFLNFPSKYENIGKTILEHILMFLFDVDLTSFTVIDYLDDEGYYARIMDRMGVKESIFYNEKKEQVELAKLCNRVLGREEVKVVSEKVDREGDFDIVFCKGNDRGNQCICRKYLFIEWENGMQEKEKEEEEDYSCLYRSYHEGNFYEIGVRIMK